MPGKHVHFALPSPSTSYSSFASSPGPETPPSLPIHLPPHSSSRSNTHSKPPAPQLHPLLVCSAPLAINWDLSLPPSTATTPYTSLSTRRGLLSEPALIPPTSELTLRVLESSWQILVRPRSNGAYITASDVLHAIYYGLRENVRSEEFYALPSKHDMRRVSEAYQKRYKRIRRSEEERRAGMKRVDFLADRKSFAGLARLGPGFYMICVA